MQPDDSPRAEAEQRIRRLWLETALIFAAWTVFGLLLANQGYMQSQLRGQSVPWVRVLRPSLLEGYLWAFATLAIFWLARRFPLERGRVLRHIAVHLVAAVVLSLARAGFVVELSRHVDWLGVRSFSRQFWGSSSLNFLFYALLLGIAHAVLDDERFEAALQRARERIRQQQGGDLDRRLRALLETVRRDHDYLRRLVVPTGHRSVLSERSRSTGSRPSAITYVSTWVVEPT